MIPNNQPLCETCNLPMTVRPMTDLFAVSPQSTDVVFICEKCGRTIPYPAESRLFP
jgi:RNase P subunit RPR2